MTSAAESAALQSSMMIVQQSIMQLHAKLDTVGEKVNTSVTLQQPGAAFGTAGAVNPYAMQGANPYMGEWCNNVDVYCVSLVVLCGSGVILVRSNCVIQLDFYTCPSHLVHIALCPLSACQTIINFFISNRLARRSAWRS